MKYTPEQRQEAREAVANWWRDNATAIRRNDRYAEHVTEEEKDRILERGLQFAESIRSGKQDGNFTVAQRIHTHLTGDCPALLP